MKNLGNCRYMLFSCSSTAKATTKQHYTLNTRAQRNWLFGLGLDRDWDETSGLGWKVAWEFVFISPVWERDETWLRESIGNLQIPRDLDPAGLSTGTRKPRGNISKKHNMWNHGILEHTLSIRNAKQGVPNVPNVSSSAAAASSSSVHINRDTIRWCKYYIYFHAPCLTAFVRMLEAAHTRLCRTLLHLEHKVTNRQGQ